MAVTIEDISKHLGLSKSTVSKALNGYADVSSETRARVINATKELGYHPNRAARSLRLGRTNKIGLLINSPIQFLSDYINHVMSGAALAAERFEQNLTLYTKEVVDAEELRRICRAREVDGLLLIFDPLQDAKNILVEEQMPFVVFGRRSAQAGVSFVSPDNYFGALMLTKHLIEQGHDRIGFMARPQLGLTNSDRLAGYQRALAGAEIPFEPTLVVETRVGQRDSSPAFLQLLRTSNPPTAVIATNDLMAADAIQSAHDHGLDVPMDIAIAGFDGLKISEQTRPTLTTVQQPLGRMGQRSIEILMQHITDNTLPPIRETMPVELIIRESTFLKIENDSN